MYNCMLTTNDNPFNPFEDFNEWFRYDTEKGYNSSSRLMRIAKIEDFMSEEEVEAEIERAIDQIIEHDFLDLFKKVTKEIHYEEEETE